MLLRYDPTKSGLDTSSVALFRHSVSFYNFYFICLYVVVWIRYRASLNLHNCRVARTRYNVFLSWELRTFTTKNEVRKVRGALKLPASIVFLEHFFPNILSFTEQKVGMSFVELSDMHKNLNSIFTTCKPYYFPWGTQNVMNFDTLRSGIKLVRICKIFILFLRCEVVAIEFGFLLSRCIISILYHYHYLSLCTINAWIWCIRLLFRL